MDKVKNVVKYLGLISFVAVSVLPSVASAQTAADIQSQIQSLLTMLQQLQTQLAQVQGNAAPVWCHTFSANIGIGSGGDEVTNLATALEKEGFTVGKTDSYDETVASAITGFQEKYRSEILAPAGLKNGTGYVGGRTRAKLNALYGCGAEQQKTPVAVQQPTSVPVRQAVPVQVPSLAVEPTVPASQPLSQVWTEVTCIFVGFTGSEQSCFTTNREGKQFSFSGTSIATGKVYGERGEVLTWKSSCGGYAYTTVTGGSEYANFTCGVVQTTPQTQFSITVLTPNGGEVWQAGNSYTVSWRNNALYKQVGAHLRRKSGGPVFIDGQSSFPLGTFSFVESFAFSVPTELISADDYLIDVLDYNPAVPGSTSAKDTSDAPFSIVGTSPAIPPAAVLYTKEPTTKPPVSVTVLVPNGGEGWQTGSVGKVAWATSGIPLSSTINTIRLRDAAGVEYNLLTDTVNDGFEEIAVPTTLAPGLYRLEIKTIAGDQTVFDQSDATFTIFSPMSAIMTMQMNSMASARTASLRQTASIVESMRRIVEMLGKLVIRTSP